MTTCTDAILALLAEQNTQQCTWYIIKKKLRCRGIGVPRQVDTLLDAPRMRTHKQGVHMCGQEARIETDQRCTFMIRGSQILNNLLPPIAPP